MPKIDGIPVARVGRLALRQRNDVFFLPGSEVTVLTNSTFDVDVTLDAKRYWVVDFYAPWSGHRT